MSAFPYGVYEMLISGLREADRDEVLRRYLGGVQEHAEATAEQIRSLATLHDIDAVRADLLRHVVALLGWHGTRISDLFNRLNEAELRKLGQMSADLWKQKGLPGGYLDAMRLMTGKSASIVDYFSSRMLVGTTKLGRALRKYDPTTQSGDGYDHLRSVVLINRDGLESIDYLLLYELLRLTLPSNNEAALVYAAFYDDFVFRELSRWVIDDPDLVELVDGQAEMMIGASMTPNISAAELATWTKGARHIFSLRFESGAYGTWLRYRFMRTMNDESYYQVSFGDDGTLAFRYRIDGGPVLNLTIGSYYDFTGIIPNVAVTTDPFVLDIRVERPSQAVTEIAIVVLDVEIKRLTFVATEALWRPEQPPQIFVTSSSLPHDGRAVIDNLSIFSGDTHAQFIGSRWFSSDRRLHTHAYAEPSPPTQIPPRVLTDLTSFFTAGSGDWTPSRFHSLDGKRAAWWGKDYDTWERWRILSTEPSYTGMTQAASYLPLTAGVPGLSYDDPAKWRFFAEVYWRPIVRVPTPSTPPSFKITKGSGGTVLLDVDPYGSDAYTVDFADIHPPAPAVPEPVFPSVGFDRPASDGDDGWKIVRLADATYEFDDGYVDTITQAVDGYVTVSLELSSPFDRFLPYDTQAPHTYAFPLLDRDGNEINAATPTNNLRYLVEFFIELDDASLPVAADEVCIWLGTTPANSQPNGAGQHRSIGLHRSASLGNVYRVYAIQQSTVDTADSGVRCDVYGWVSDDSDWEEIHGVTLVSPGDTAGVEATVAASTRPSDAKIYCSFGIAKTSGSGSTTPFKCRLWYRVTEQGDDRIGDGVGGWKKTKIELPDDYKNASEPLGIEARHGEASYTDSGYGFGVSRVRVTATRVDEES